GRTQRRASPAVEAHVRSWRARGDRRRSGWRWPRRDRCRAGRRNYSGSERRKTVMARKIRLTFQTEGVSAIAELREESAPKTCAAIWEALPIRGEAHHAIYSGSETVLLLPEMVRVEPENATWDVSTGDVGYAWFLPGSSKVAETEFSEICWFYNWDARPS